MRRFLLLAGLVYLLLLAGLVLVDGRVLALALPLVVYLATALIFAPGDAELEVTRSLSDDRVHGGKQVVIRLGITNQGSSLEQILVQDLPPERLRIVEGESEALTSLRPGETIELEYSVQAVRGSHVFRDVRVTASDALGLFRREVVYSVPEKLSVLPDVLRLRRLPIRPLRTRGYAGPVPARQGGSGIDFFGVREYQTGDRQRWINWRISARHPHALFTNEFEQERIADVGLILDARSRSSIDSGGDSLFEHSIRATAALAAAFLNDGNRVGLLVYGRLLDWTLPGYGKVQRERILQSLSRAETGESRIFDSLTYLPTRFFPAKCQLVLVSPLSLEDLPMLIRLRAQGYQLLVVRPDPIAFEVAALPPRPEVVLAERIVRVERLLLLRKLQQAGIQVVDWSVDQPFDQVVHASLGRQTTWHRGIGMAG
ncbi:DUF58 domain-containing protein [Chloroflexota bacterium]